MSLKKFKPITPGQRHKVAMDMSGITTSTPEKSLVKGGTRSGGRNNDGRMTMRYLGEDTNKNTVSSISNVTNLTSLQP